MEELQGHWYREKSRVGDSFVIIQPHLLFRGHCWNLRQVFLGILEQSQSCILGRFSTHTLDAWLHVGNRAHQLAPYLLLSLAGWPGLPHSHPQRHLHWLLVPCALQTFSQTMSGPHAPWGHLSNKLAPKALSQDLFWRKPKLKQEPYQLDLLYNCLTLLLCSPLTFLFLTLVLFNSCVMQKKYELWSSKGMSSNANSISYKLCVKAYESLKGLLNHPKYIFHPAFPQLVWFQCKVHHMLL